MKILIGYDGSDCASAALDDLKNAGLPARAEVEILTVTENWTLILENREKGHAVGENLDDDDDAKIEKTVRENALQQLAEAERLARAAGERVRQDFPHWEIRSTAVAEFPVRGVIETAKKFQPDLIVVGSHGRSALGRLILGSLSLKILTESSCSVRVARCAPARTFDDDSPTRVILGIDGSPDSLIAVEAAAKRTWRQNSAVRLVTAIEPFVDPALFFDMQKAEDAQKAAARRLEAAGLHVSTTRKLGTAKEILVEEAAKWGADAIFIGARGHRWTERILLGSVSYAVAARADCSVEVVRENLYAETDSKILER